MFKAATLAFVAAASCTSSLAQIRLDARSFPPEDFRAEIYVDFARLVDSGIWDAVRGSAVGAMLSMVERELGFSLSELDSLRMYPELNRRSERPEHWRKGGVLVMVGSDELLLPVPANHRQEQFGGYDAAIDDRDWVQRDPDMWLQVEPGLLVYGTRHLLEPVVEGKATPGLPSGEFLSLTSGQDGLAHVVLGLEEQDLRELPFAVPDGLIDAADRPQFLALRMWTVVGADDDEDDPQVLFEAIVRCQDGSKAPELLVEFARQSVEQARQHPRLAALEQIWSKLEFSINGRDVKARLPLGRTREAGGNLAMLMAPLWLFSTPSVEAAPLVLVGELPLEPPAPVDAAAVPLKSKQARPKADNKAKAAGQPEVKVKAGGKAKAKPKAEGKPKTGSGRLSGGTARQSD